MNTTLDGTCQGEKCSTGIPSQITLEDSKKSCPSNEQYFDSRIKFVAPGSVFADLTTVSILLALLAPYTTELNGTLDGGRMESFEARSTNILKSVVHCIYWQQRKLNGGIALSVRGLGVRFEWHMVQ
jgi:hypothetical protein